VTPPATIADRTRVAGTRTTVPRRSAARPAAQPQPRRLRAPHPRVAERLRALPDAPWLDRLVRGSGWIPLVALGLLGIVFMQVTMLKLNAGIGRAVETAATLERQNGELRDQVSRLDSGERIEAVARKLGMVVPAAGSQRYVTVRPGRTDARAAARNVTRPDPVQPGSTLPAKQAAAAPAEQAAPPAAAGAPAATAPQATSVAPVQQAAPVPAPTPTPAATGGAAPVAQAPTAPVGAPAG